jgi:hypothetical protein
MDLLPDVSMHKVRAVEVIGCVTTGLIVHLGATSSFGTSVRMGSAKKSALRWGVMPWLMDSLHIDWMGRTGWMSSIGPKSLLFVRGMKANDHAWKGFER